MEILSLKEYLKSSDNNEIHSYLDYIQEEKGKIEGALEEANKLSSISIDISNKVVFELKRKIDFISIIENIVENSMEEALRNTITSMSEEELVSLANTKIKDISSQIEELESKVAEKEETIKKIKENKRIERINKGLDIAYLNVSEDADMFFADSNDVTDFLSKLISSNYDTAFLEDFFYSICNNIETSAELASKIMSFRMILSYTDKTLELKNEMVESLLSKEVLGAYISLKNEDDIKCVVRDAIEKVKKSTDRFMSLPSITQAEINKFGFNDSETYKEMQRMYYEYKETGVFIEPNYDDSVDVLEISNSIKKINTEISSLSEKKGLIDAAINKGYKELVSLFTKDIELTGGTSLNHFMLASDDANVYNGKKERLENCYSYSKLIDEYLKNPVSKKDFEIRQAINSLRLMNIFGDATNEVSIGEIRDSYTRRLEQFKTISELINRLRRKKEEIEQVKNSKNIFKKKNNAMMLEKLYQEYKDCCNEFFNDLRKKGLLKIKVAYSYLDKEDELFERPNSLDELFDGKSVEFIKLSPENFMEFKMYGAIPEEMKYEELLAIFTTAYVLSGKLFTAKKSSDDLYDFAISDSEISQLITANSMLAELYNNLYNARKQEREKLVMLSNMKLSKEAYELMSKLSLTETSSFNRESLEKMRDGMISEAATLEEELRSFIVGSNENIDNIEDIEAYREFLEGFESLKVQKEEISLKL